MTDLPTFDQLRAARGALTAASEMAIMTEAAHAISPGSQFEGMRRSVVNDMSTAARALGLELVRRDGPRVVVDNTEPNAMREVK